MSPRIEAAPQQGKNEPRKAGLRSMSNSDGHTLKATRDPDRPVRLWLYVIAGLVFAMVVVGGATRLTDSGLSITEWKPILGAIPPLDDSHWQAAFAKYKEIPEYELVNKGMSLEEFKFIYWWEWGHRFLGRIIGAAFALPLLFFWVRGRLRPGLSGKLLGLLALGGLQGAIGWYMVSSGLVDRIDVSQYRLALHLGVAFLIFALTLWIANGLIPAWKRRPPGHPGSGDAPLALAVVAATMLQVVLGAFVAGLDAGLAYNTWPLMDGKIVPDGILRLDPWYLNPFENHTTVQFNHRVMAYAVTALAIWQALRMWARPQGEARRTALYLALGILVQVGLGIWTLIAAVPLWLGIVHQAGAVVVLGLAVWHLAAVTRAHDAARAAAGLNPVPASA